MRKGGKKRKKIKREKKRRNRTKKEEEFSKEGIKRGTILSAFLVSSIFTPFIYTSHPSMSMH